MEPEKVDPPPVEEVAAAEEIKQPIVVPEATGPENFT